MQYAICRYLSHKIISITLNFWDIKISIPQLDSPRKTALEHIKKSKFFFTRFQDGRRGHVFFRNAPQKYTDLESQKAKVPAKFQANQARHSYIVIALTDPIHMQYAICRYFGHKIVSILLNFWDIKISIAPLDSPRKTAVEHIKKSKNFPKGRKRVF